MNIHMYMYIIYIHIHMYMCIYVCMYVFCMYFVYVPTYAYTDRYLQVHESMCGWSSSYPICPCAVVCNITSPFKSFLRAWFFICRLQVWRSCAGCRVRSCSCADAHAQLMQFTDRTTEGRILCKTMKMREYVCHHIRYVRF